MVVKYTYIYTLGGFTPCSLSSPTPPGRFASFALTRFAPRQRHLWPVVESMIKTAASAAPIPVIPEGGSWSPPPRITGQLRRE